MAELQELSNRSTDTQPGIESASKVNEKRSPPVDGTSECEATVLPKNMEADKRNAHIKYKVEYENDDQTVYMAETERPVSQFKNDADKDVVLEKVDVRLTWLTTDSPELKDKTSNEANKVKVHKQTDILPPYLFDGRPYMYVVSPAIIEALRCVCDYYPDYNFNTKRLKVQWPYAIFWHLEKELSAYQEALQGANCRQSDPPCPNRGAADHLAVVKDFVQDATGDAVAEERERHARGMATYEMLWLLLQPGADIYCDSYEVGEWEPYVIKSVTCEVVHGSIVNYWIYFWSMTADSYHIGPGEDSRAILPFVGEKEITSLLIYPCDFAKTDKQGRTAEERKQSFIERGKKYFKLRKRGCWYFDGFSTYFPRLPYTGFAMVDPIQYAYIDAGRERRVLAANFEETSGDTTSTCSGCGDTVRSLRRTFKFPKYSKINPLTAEGLTDHQYFLCERVIEAFLFKQREWQELDVSGFREAEFDKRMLETLVMEPKTKRIIKDLTDQYMKGLRADEEKQAAFDKQGISRQYGQLETTSWSADFVKGKGGGLIFLLHGKPGVGKTYTAECIAAHAERPLLSLTSSDLGTEPSEFESKIMRWFHLAKRWSIILLIDEADIYMEYRQVQDLERNNLVAGFLRAMEYCQGILFLTTNRVGTFDEAFISRINITIYYRPFDNDQRQNVWENFFKKLEREREEKMRIHMNTRDYVRESSELAKLEWNGREIRNAFQIAVALAETADERDAQGRILLRPEHIEETVKLSAQFQSYLDELHKKSEAARAAQRGNRLDAFGLKREDTFL